VCQVPAIPLCDMHTTLDCMRCLVTCKQAPGKASSSGQKATACSVEHWLPHLQPVLK